MTVRPGLCAFLLFFVASNASGQEAKLPRTIDRSEVHTLVAAGGDRYEIAVALPRTYATSNARYPVLLVLDGDGLFPLAAELATLLGFLDAREVIVVGVGARPARPGLRSRDFTPTVAPEPATIEQGPDDGPHAGGGAAAFLAFVAETVLPHVETRFRTDTTQRGIFGHSYGGLFVLYALFQRPDLFSRYMASSPSLWWDRRVLFRLEAQYADAHRDLKARVFIGNGRLEESDARGLAFAQLRNASELSGQLRARNYASLTLHTNVFPGETHTSVIPHNLSRGIRLLYGR